MKTRNAILTAMALTLGAAVAGGFWALSPFIFYPIEILGDYDPVQLIRKLFPIHIVDPSWIHAAKDDLDMMWCFAEFRARAAIVLAAWLVAMTVLIIRVWRGRSAIHSVQLTAARCADSGG
jgi:hypothetical protein